MICDFLKSFTREEKARAKPADHHARATGARTAQPQSLARSLAVYRGRREIDQ